MSYDLQRSLRARLKTYPAHRFKYATILYFAKAGLYYRPSGYEHVQDWLQCPGCDYTHPPSNFNYLNSLYDHILESVSDYCPCLRSVLQRERNLDREIFQHRKDLCKPERDMLQAAIAQLRR